jgi:hypothetical protein
MTTGEDMTAVAEGIENRGGSDVIESWKRWWCGATTPSLSIGWCCDDRDQDERKERSSETHGKFSMGVLR